MKDKKFREAWLIKAKKASIMGNKKIKILLNDEEYRKQWIERCSFGGKKSFKNKIGIFDLKYRKKRIIWSKKGLKKTSVKIFGPKKEKMYNHLEVCVARILIKNNKDYEYSKIIKLNNLNGYYSVDFVTNKIAIEVTYWDNVNIKAKKLMKKFEFLKSNNMFKRYILITKNKFKDRYKRLLPQYIIILTPEELSKNIDKILI